MSKEFKEIIKKLDWTKNVESYIIKMLSSKHLQSFENWVLSNIASVSGLNVDLICACVDILMKRPEVKKVHDNSFVELREKINASYDKITHKFNQKEELLDLLDDTRSITNLVDDSLELETQVGLLWAYYEIVSRLEYAYWDKPIFTDKKLLHITKVRSYSVYFDYGYNKFFLHNTNGDSIDSMVLYRRYPLGNGKYELQYMSSTRGVRCSDIQYGKFNPNKRGTTYKNVDVDKFLIWLQYYGLISGYSTERVNAIKKRNKERLEEIQVLERIVNKLRCEIRELKE